MMRVLFCLTCRRAYQVIGELQEVKHLLDQPQWERGFPCVTPLCRGMLTKMYKEHREGVLGLHELVDVPIKNFYRAIHGFGLGEGDAASVSTIRELLLKERVVDIVADAVGSSERVILKELVLSSGTRIHLGSSHLGACVYYVEGPETCLEVFDNEVRAEEAARGVPENREEVGRAVENLKGLADRARTVAGSTPSHEQSVPVPAVPTSSDVSAGGAIRTDEHDSDDSGVRV